MVIAHLPRYLFHCQCLLQQRVMSRPQQLSKQGYLLEVAIEAGV
ncbi:hypothetical protein OIU74_023739, partial [Salix koriyanagi]